MNAWRKMKKEEGEEMSEKERVIALLDLGLV